MNLDSLIKNLCNPEPGQDQFNCYSTYDKMYPCRNEIDELGINAYLSGPDVSVSQLFVIQFGYCISLKNSLLYLFKYQTGH